MIDRLASLLRNRHTLALVGRGAQAAFGMVAFVLLARLLSSDGLGAWVLYLAAVSFANVCREGVVKTALVRYAAGRSGDERAVFVGAGWILAIVVTALESGAVALWAVSPFVPDGFDLFVSWYPLLAWCSLPFQFGTWIAEANDRFERMALGNVVNSGGFTLAVGGAFGMAAGWAPPTVAAVHVAFAAATSLLFVLLRWTWITTAARFTVDALAQLFAFGKYSVGTLIGSHLLSSSDVYILGFLLGPSAVALYSVGQKAVRLVEVPLQAFSSTAFPTLSDLHQNDDIVALQQYTHRWTAAMTALFIPVLVVLFVWAEPVVVLLGGADYAGAAPILRWFTLYLLFSPLSRALGMLLDSINRPQFNLYKVGVMVTVNVAGDVAVLLLWASIPAVAAVTTLTLLSGVVMGLYFVRPFAPIRVSALPAAGRDAVAEQWQRWTHRASQQS